MNRYFADASGTEMSDARSENPFEVPLAKRIRSVIAMALVEIEQEFSEMTPASRADLIVSRLVESGFDVTELDLNA